MPFSITYFTFDCYFLPHSLLFLTFFLLHTLHLLTIQNNSLHLLAVFHYTHYICLLFIVILFTFADYFSLLFYSFLQGCESSFIFCGSGSSCSSQCGSESSSLKIQIWIQPNKICNKLLHEVLKQTKKDCAKVINNGVCPHLVHFLY